MRWKLLVVASLIATIIGAGANLLVAYGLPGSVGGPAPGSYGALAALLIPVAAIVSASIFVYRHTARRRPLQAIATALLAALLTLAALTAGSIYLARRTPAHAPPARVVS